MTNTANSSLNVGDLKKLLEKVPDDALILLYDNAGYWDVAITAEVSEILDSISLKPQLPDLRKPFV